MFVAGFLFRPFVTAGDGPYYTQLIQTALTAYTVQSYGDSCIMQFDTPEAEAHNATKDVSMLLSYFQFFVAAKAVDLVGNPVWEVGDIAFVAADVECIEGYFATGVVAEVFSVAAGW